MKKLQAIIIDTQIDKKRILFAVSHPDDAIQAHHLKGEFYEKEELNIITEHSRSGGVFLDIGANVGNHTLFVEKFLDYDKIVAIEPNIEAFVTLDMNVRLNRADKVDLRYLGIALGKNTHNAKLVADKDFENNLGGTSVVTESDGSVRVIAGDDLFAGMPVQFIKIDVEGMEMEVLAGLRKTIETWRPNIFIEVKEGNEADFLSYMSTCGYEQIASYERYATLKNYMMSHKSNRI